MSCDPDGFIGVERKRRKTKKFFLTGLAENVNENQILSYLNKKNIIPTYISKYFPQSSQSSTLIEDSCPFGCQFTSARGELLA